MKFNITDLTPKDQELLQSVLDTQVEDMTEEQRGILRARRDYLTAVQREEFAEVLEEVNTQKPIHKMTAEELRAYALELGLVFDENIKHKELLALVKSAQ